MKDEQMTEKLSEGGEMQEREPAADFKKAPRGVIGSEEVRQADKPQAKPQPQASGDAWKYV